MKKTLLFMSILILIGMYCTQVWGTNSAGYHGLDDSLLSIGFGAANLAVAESNIAQTQNPYANQLNPAGLTGIQRPAIYFLQNNLADGVDIYSVNLVGSPWARWTLSLNWVQMQILNIPLVSADQYDLNTDIEPDIITTAVENGLIGAAAYSLTDNIHLGLAAAIFQYRFSALSDKGSGISMTPGTIYQLTDHWSLAGTVKNLFSSRQWSTGTVDQLDPIVTLGTQYQLGNIGLFYLAEKGNQTPVIFRYGLEYYAFKIVKFRVGVYPVPGHLAAISGSELDHLNAGLGVNLGILSVDYTYLGKSNTEFADSSRINIGIQL